MNAVVRLAVAFAAGAAVMYYFDPMIGRRRRALVRDRGVAARHRIEAAARAKTKQTADRVKGAMARRRAEMSIEPVDDVRLHERIRAKLGHVVAHSSAVEVEVLEGHVVLAGRVDASEIVEVIDAVSAMPGVVSIDNRLVVEGPAKATMAGPAQDARH